MRVGFWYSGVLPLAMALTAEAAPHHSSAMLDTQKTLKLTGAVRDFQCHKPHVYIQLLVTNENGDEEEWSNDRRELEGDTFTIVRESSNGGARP